MATTRVVVTTIRQAGNLRDDLRDVRWKMEDVRGLTGVGSLVFLNTNYTNYAQISIPMDVERRPIYERQGQGVLMLCLRRWLNDGLQVGRV